MYTLPTNTHVQRSYEDIETFMEAYFEQAAIKLLGHSPQIKSFFVNNDVEDATEIEEAMHSQLKLPALILDSFDDELSDTDSNTYTIYESNITVVDSFKQGDARDLREKRRQCRAVLKKIVFKMLRDSYQPLGGVLITNKIYLERDSLRGMHLGMIGGIFTGWTVSFRWKVQESLNFGKEDFQ